MKPPKTPEQIAAEQKKREAEERRVAEAALLTGVALVFEVARIANPNRAEEGDKFDAFLLANQFLVKAKQNTGVDLLDELLKAR